LSSVSPPGLRAKGRATRVSGADPEAAQRQKASKVGAASKGKEMTRDECRKIEGMQFPSGCCKWPDAAIDESIARWEKAVDRLARGESIHVGESMGSCQCGDIWAVVTVRDGVVWCHTTGRHKWQQYEGPAGDCHVPYGVGTRARQLASAWRALQEGGR
jgi:hypothetical protein